MLITRWLIFRLLLSYTIFILVLLFACTHGVYGAQLGYFSFLIVSSGLMRA